MERQQVIALKNMRPRIYLIRHGETEWSLASRHTSRTDIPLTEQGEQDARKLGERLRDLTFSQVFTSPRQRARRTCELAGLGPVAKIEPDLAEWDYGDYEGQHSVDIHKGLLRLIKPHCQLRISGRSSPYLSMYCLCSISLSFSCCFR